jgi:hypothetical protein
MKASLTGFASFQTELLTREEAKLGKKDLASVPGMRSSALIGTQ